MRKFIDFLIVFLPVIACILIYFLDEGLKRALTLIPSELTIFTMYTTNFVHYSLGHLTGNLVIYLVFSLLSIVFYYRLGYRRIFEASLIIILLIVPVTSSLFSATVLPSSANIKPLYGFSAVSSAVIGLFGFGIVLYMSLGEKTDVICLYLFLVLTSLGLAVLTYDFVHFGIVSILLALILLALTARRHRNNSERTKRYYKALLLLSVYLFSMVSIFPEQLIVGHSFVNIVGHWVGLLFGITIPYFVWMIDEMSRKPINHMNTTIEQ